MDFTLSSATNPVVSQTAFLFLESKDGRALIWRHLSDSILNCQIRAAYLMTVRNVVVTIIRREDRCRYRRESGG